VGRWKPNDFGLFDMHGNVWFWCLGADKEADKDYRRGEAGQVTDDEEELDLLKSQQPRVLRGACHTDLTKNVHSGIRWRNVPDAKTNLLGFCLARTIARH
jgi:formylglycine-generating enzyme required for sulfatase activity